MYIIFNAAFSIYCLNITLPLLLQNEWEQLLTAKYHDALHRIEDLVCSPSAKLENLYLRDKIDFELPASK